jgi:putative PIN family toxin of toxin-antitoxin system
MIVIIDCNVIVSAGLKDGFVRQAMRKIIEKHQIVISAEILDEYESVARYPKFDLSTSMHILETIESVESCAKFVEPHSCNFTSPDPTDIIYLEAAVISNADYIITGNMKHFPAKQYGKAQVVTIREFSDLFFR